MDNELYERIEDLELLCKKTLEAVGGLREELSGLRKEFSEFREEQRERAKKTDALLKQFGARIGGVEGQMSAMQERIQAVEDVVFK